MMNNNMIIPRDLKKIERQLERSLQPVKPPAMFVKELRGRLDAEMLKKQKSKKVKVGLLIAGGVVGGVALLITLIRSLTSWDQLSAAVSRVIPRIKKREQAASV
jgi:hypothetical protein